MSKRGLSFRRCHAISFTAPTHVAMRPVVLASTGSEMSMIGVAAASASAINWKSLRVIVCTSWVGPAVLQGESQPPPARGGGVGWLVDYPVSEFSLFGGLGSTRPDCSVVICVGSECPGRIRHSVHRAAFQRPTLSPVVADSNTCPGGRFIVNVRLYANRLGRACLRPSVLSASRRFLGYRRSYWLLRHSCGVPANVGWRWIGRVVAFRLLMRGGGGTVLWVPPAATSGHSAVNVRG